MFTLVRKNVLTAPTPEMMLHKLCFHVLSDSFLIATDVRASLSVIIKAEWLFSLSEAVGVIPNEMWSCHNII